MSVADTDEIEAMLINRLRQRLLSASFNVKIGLIVIAIHPYFVISSHLSIFECYNAFLHDVYNFSIVRGHENRRATSVYGSKNFHNFRSEERRVG